jgi:hypothetical protein
VSLSVCRFAEHSARWTTCRSSIRAKDYDEAHDKVHNDICGNEVEQKSAAGSYGEEGGQFYGAICQEDEDILMTSMILCMSSKRIQLRADPLSPFPTNIEEQDRKLKQFKLVVQCCTFVCLLR